MLPVRIAVVAFLITSFSAIVSAQRPGPEFRRLSDCEFGPPRTKLEEMETSYEKVLIKGFTQIAVVNLRGADVRVDAVEMKESKTGGERAFGLAIIIREGAETPREVRSFVDYEEIDRLVRALDAVVRVNEGVTKLAGFEARYRTLGDLEIRVFRQSRTSGTAATIMAGTCDRAVALLTLDDLERLRAHILEAKTRLDEIR